VVRHHPRYNGREQAVFGAWVLTQRAVDHDLAEQTTTWTGTRRTRCLVFRLRQVSSSGKCPSKWSSYRLRLAGWPRKGLLGSPTLNRMARSRSAAAAASAAAATTWPRVGTRRRRAASCGQASPGRVNFIRTDDCAPTTAQRPYPW